MDFTKIKNIPGIAVFLDFEKAFDSIEWEFIQKCLESFNFGPNLGQWISVFYKDISSCVINNGVASKHFYLERGVRQGCPLSGILFVIAMELLAQSIRRSKDIKGIHVRGNEEVKLTQYADDTTALLADVQSVSKLFDLLSLFEKCSGLKINPAKSEMLWLGSLRHRKDAICNLQLSDDPVYALGVHFIYDIELSHKKSFFEKLGSLQKTLSVWSRRDLSIYGRINIVKTLALSKLVFISSVMEIPRNFAAEVNKMVLDFIWKQKPAKTKKTTLVKTKSDGGLGMKDFVLFDKALKLIWVKRLCSNSDGPWKYIPNSFLSTVGGTELFQCNYSYNLLDLKGPLPEFYNQIIRHWQKIVSTTPHSKTEILSQTIWNNKFITIDKKMVYLPHWHQAGIKQISDLFDEQKNCFLPFLSLCNKYRLNCNFLQYHGLISAIPQSWKKLLHVNSDDSIATSPPPIGTITCKMLYNRLLTLENLPPPTSEKKLLSYGIAKENLNKIYLLPFTATKEVKLAMFQYKIIHNILATNSILYKMKKVASPSCPFCPSDCQNMHHLFISCPQASSFWYKFQRWCSTVCNASLLLSEPEVLFGITRPCTHRLTLNHLIMLGKCFLYINALNNTKFVFNDSSL